MRRGIATATAAGAHAGPRALGAVAAGALVATLALASGSLAAPSNPANHRSLIDRPIEPYRYDYGERCVKRLRPGAVALRRWLGRNFPGASISEIRCEKLSSDRFSLHAEGRAIDWALDAAVPREKRAAQRLIRRLLAEDKNGNHAALARRMGVQGLIFNCRSWWSSSGGLGRYGYCFNRKGRLKKGLDRTAAHRDHVHIELNRPGARKRTSFWKSAVSRR